MLGIGLTGGIGTGKSHVARLLQSLGASVINADEVGHEAYTPDSESWHEVVKTFGKEILQPSGEIDRQKLNIGRPAECVGSASVGPGADCRL